MFNASTAYIHWDNQWQNPQSREDWTTPEAAVTQFLPVLKEKKVKQILDLGGGVGRHALFFAAHGFKVSMTDLSPHGLHFAKNKAQEENIELSTHLADMATLPFGESFFDYILAWNVIYHGTKGNLIHSLIEINRVLRIGGFFQATLLSKNNHNFQVGQEVSKDTWINSEKGDKAHPHYYCDKVKLKKILKDAGFYVTDLEEVEQSLKGSYHWNIVAIKKSHIE